MHKIKFLPIPISGLALGLAALGNLIGRSFPTFRLALGAVSMVIILAVLLKGLMFREVFMEDMKNPVIATVSSTIGMAVILHATYWKPYVGGAAVWLWWGGILLHALVFLYVIMRFVLRDFKLEQVFPSWFITFVGAAVASVTAPVFEVQPTGQLIFWISLILYLVALALVINRFIKKPQIPAQAKPTLVIFAAPAALLLAGYFSSFSTVQPVMVVGLGVLVIFFYLFGLVQCAKQIRNPFNPGFSAFTFPLVISSIALNGLIKWTGNESMGLGWIGTATKIIAAVVVLYVLFEYTRFIIKMKSTS